MNLFFEICRYAAGNLVMGIFASAIVIAILFFVIKRIYKDAAFTPLSVIAGAALFVLLSYQFVTMSCAMDLRSMCGDFQACVDNMMPSLEKNNALMSEETAETLVDRTIDEYPLLGNFLDSASIIGCSTLNVASTMAQNLDEMLKGYIWKRILWSLLFIALATFLVIVTMDSHSARSYSGRPTRGSGHSGFGSPNRRGHSGQRISGF